MRTPLLKKLIALAACLLLTATAARAQKTTEILWDNYGVPHVYGATENDMYYAFGWAQMHNHANLLLKLYGQARGRAAEYWGEQYVASDKQIHLFNLPETARQTYAKNKGADKARLDAFVNGVNAYARAHPEALDPAMKQVLPITAPDVLAHTARVLCLEFLASEDIQNVARTLAPGSNSYAIAPSKSASKNALLVANPHLPWSDFYLFFEAQLTAPGFNAYGTALVGMPVLTIAFNEHLGWTHTVNTIDASDRYALTLREGGYLLDGKTQAFEKKTVALKIRQPDGSLKTQDLALSYAKQGPVVGEKNGKAYAVRIAGLENAFLGAQYHAMAKAANWKAFESALKRQQNPMFNVVYADQTGNILYLFNGNVPKRAEGDWAFWHGTVDGTSSKYIWSQYHPYADLPKVFNPATGFVQNANDAPWTSTYPPMLKPESFPAYMSPRETMALRPQHAVNMIKDDASITYDELVAYKLNTTMEAADRFLDDLLAAVQQHPEPTADKAAAVLRTWDKATNADSRGAVLFARWFDQIDAGMMAVPFNSAQPVTTPDGLKDPQGAVALLVKAATEVEKQYGSLDVAWGDVNRFKVGGYEFPANGGSAEYGLFRTIYFQRNPADNKNYAFYGDSYVAITEFGPKVKAQVLLSYGNATQPGSKHIGDQLSLLAQKKLRPALLTRAEVLANTEEKEQLRPSPAMP